jgi:hypothetical protein
LDKQRAHFRTLAKYDDRFALAQLVRGAGHQKSELLALVGDAKELESQLRGDVSRLIRSGNGNGEQGQQATAQPAKSATRGMKHQMI